MKNKVNNFILSLFVFTLSFFLILPGLPNSFAANVTHEIRTFEDLINAASLSRSSGYNSDTYILMNNITITEENQNTLENSDFKYISFGSTDNPFSGIFEGNGYSISNLSYDADLSVKSDTGLFSETNGATIRNLVIDNASLQADYRGGIVVGYSKNTTIENVVVKNSHLNVAASNNVVSLITDGGIRGGAIVGEAVDTIIYNCESNNTIVNTNNTAGVAALSGKGLTLGALVGISDNTLIEYSRVYGGKVSNYYDVAVGALGGNTLYVGGIAGKMRNSSKVIDSFSTAELYYYCATYVSVGAGNSGHIGGISATMEGSSCEIVRSHYAGNATSRQYNAVLVIPIIQNNVNISGIVDVYDGGSVVNSYFKPSASPDTNMNVLGNDSSTSSYGPISDEKYINKDFWQSVFYDFMGNVKRISDYNDSHYNKWVMDLSLGVPIHGKSVAATFDFEGASEVIIDKTNLISTPVSTTNPYVFAVQGLTPNEYFVNIKANVNSGYKFIGWYKIPNVTAWQLEENHEYFDEVFNKYDIISSDLNLENIPCDDNNLFIARFKASVIFHDINGDIINKSGTLDSNTDDDWYDYNDDFPSILPINKPSSSTASLIGWTTKQGGYSAISMSELGTIKNNGTFYELDSTVTSSLNLYPVYADLVSNITTIFEGNELDSSSNMSLRENIGYTTTTMNDDGSAVISAIGYGENNAFPTGYRFLGWYDEAGNKVSKDTSFSLDEYDLTQKHTFTARLEYKVDYYGVTTKFYDNTDFNGNPFSKPFATIWHTYEQTLVDMSSSVILDEGDDFSAWYFGIPNIPHNSNNYGSCAVSSSTTKVTETFSIHAHVSGDSSSYEIYILSDFPGAASISHTDMSWGGFEVSANVNSGYNFLFWASGRSNGNAQNTSTNAMNWDSGVVHGITSNYGYEAHLDANVVFHDKNSSVYKTVTRRYQEKVFSSSDITYQYTWPIKQNNMNITVSGKNVSNGIHTSLAFAYNLSDSNMQKEGYRFIGWIDKNSISASDWDYVYGTTGQTYGVSSDPYVTKSINTASAYLLDEEDICTKPMDIYPVYVKYDIITKTNVSNDGLTVEINVPTNPTYVIEETGNLYAKVSLTVDLDTYVIGSSGTKYNLTSVIRLYEDGRKEVIEVSNDGTYKYDVSPDITYTFVANYEPLVLIYHLNDTDTESIIKLTGEEVGDIPNPTYDLSLFTDNHLFVGYTRTKPTTGGYHNFNSMTSYNESNISVITSSMLVSSSMELWPVYVSSNITVNSNIDSYLSNKSINLNTVRNYSRVDNNKFKLNVDEIKIDDYEFVGWYKNYENLSNIGEQITVSEEFTLTFNESFSSDTYTAVYKKVYDINYYGKENNLLYQVKVSEDDDRTFVVTTTDENGNEVLTINDYEAFENMYNTLLPNEVFYNWQWQKDDNTIVKWEDFYNKPITNHMNLYPIVNEITLLDENNNEIDVIGNNEKAPDVILGIKNNNLLAYFNTVYEESKITVNVNQIAYNKTSYTTNAIENVNITFYSENNTDASILGEEKTNNEGNAIFIFKGLFTILKNKLDSKQEDVFIFNIYNKKDLNNKILTVSIKNGESIRLLLPYGEYVIEEDENWAWRYEYEASGNFKVNNTVTGSVVFENTTKNNKWFDHMSNIKNRF